MENFSNDYLGKHRQFRINSKKLATAFLISAFVVVIIVFWWLKLVGITVTGEAFCGIDEHTHGEDCYISELICGHVESTTESVTADETESAVTEVSQEAADESTTAEVTTEATTEAATEGGTSVENVTDVTEKTEESTTAEETTQVETTPAQSEASLEETQTSASAEAVALQVHTHSDECYRKTLVCTETEHTHTAECFPDKTADVETVSDWLATFEDAEITNNIPENLIAVALSQMGYEESNNNFEYDSEGVKNGYTRYGEWYGNPYGKWNTMFLSFCLHYSNINNSDELKASGAEAMRLAWQGRGVYKDEADYSAKRGDVIFLDADADAKADSVGIITSDGSNNLVVITGDSNNRVETITVEKSGNILGYGLTGELSFAKDMEYEESEKPQEPESQEAEEVTEPEAAKLMLYSTPKATIKDVNDLTEVVKSVQLKTTEGDILTDGSMVYIGQTYVISMTFAEVNTGDTWLQFKHDDDHHLHYQIPENIKFEPFTEWHSITAKTENGTVEDVGKYFLREDGMLIVIFEDDKDGLCFGAKYSNVEFTIDFNAKIGSADTENKVIVDYGNEVEIEYTIDGGAGITMSKNHGEYDADNHTMEYTVRVEATHGLVKDFTLEDYTWNTHKILRDTIVVTDLEGNVLDPQPTVGDSFTGGYSGFSVVGLPDFSAGEGYLVTYKTKVDDNLISNDTVSLSNGAYGAGKDSNGATVDSYKEDWVVVELEKMTKDGKQTVLKDENGNDVPVIEWEVAIKKNNSNLQGTVVIDTLGAGLQYYTKEPIIVKHYDENNKPLADQIIEWDQVTVNGNSMSFPLPDGYMFDIFYYTTYDLPENEEQYQYNNSVSATINGKYETAGGEADVVGFVPHIQKNAYGNDGEYAYFTIEADVPGVIKDWGGFYLSDTASLWNQATSGFLYSENFPEDLVITAYTESGRTVEFTPYVEGGPTENTYILLSPGLYNTHHTFNIFFNTSTANEASSKWILSEDSKLSISYKIPFDSKTGAEWDGNLTGDKSLEDALIEGYTLNNKATLNYTSVIVDDASAPYKYSPKITKKSVVNEDGTIDYTVVFHNTIPGTNGNSGYLASSNIAYFTDTFDERLVYVPGSLTVTCYDPWNSNNWLNRYRYNGTVNGNSMEIASTQFTFDKWNPACGWDEGWLSGLSSYQEYCNNMGGGDHIFTYKLRVKDDYLYSTEQNRYEFDNTAEVKWDNDGSSGPVTERTEFKTGLVDKNVVQRDNKLDFDIHINRHSIDILKGVDKLTIEDTMTPNLSVYWESIRLYYEDEDGEWVDFESTDKYDYSVTYDQNANKLTFVVPDELHIRIDYSTLITESGLVSINNSVSINASASVTDIIDATFHVQEHSGGASGSMHEIMLLKQDGTTDVRLPGVTFFLYGPMGDPDAILPDSADRYIVTDNNKTLGFIGSYTTGADGTVEIKTQYLTVGGPYALVESVPPVGYNALEKPVYFYFYEPDPNGIIQTVTTLIAVENYTYGFVLPETGGTGTLPLAIIGITLMALPVLYSTIRRKRERGLT